MFAASNIQYEISDRARGVSTGGIGAIHFLARRVGLIGVLDKSLHLPKRHLPYHESDHVLNIAYNIMAGNTRLEDIELLRQNEASIRRTPNASVPSSKPPGAATVLTRART